MKTWLDFESKKWVSEQPKKYWTGLICEETGEKIFTGDTISILWFSTRKTFILDPCFYGNNTFQLHYKPILISHNKT